MMAVPGTDFTLQAAAAADARANWPLAAEFCMPRSADGPLIYLCGHSLGLAPRRAAAFVEQELADWRQLGVLAHEQAQRPWIEYAELASQGLARLTGARPADVLAMNSLSVNLHLLLASFYRPQGIRRRVLIESGAFSSDRHAIATQIAWHGLDPATELVELAPREGEDLLRAEDIDAAIDREGERLALVLWPGVQFRTGQAFDCARLTRRAQAVGATVGFDHAHAIGNVELDLPGCGADFAVWCSYKYLNAGPGAIGGAYVAARHSEGGAARLAGWWGHDAATRFAMSPRFAPAYGAAGWAVSNPPIFSAAPLLASLQIFAEVDLAILRQRSQALTQWFESALLQHCGAEIQLISPREAAARGAMLSLRLKGGAQRCRRVFATLGALGVLGDFREPDVLRLTPAPLYNTFSDVQQAAQRFAEALQRCA